MYQGHHRNYKKAFNKISYNNYNSNLSEDHQAGHYGQRPFFVKGGYNSHRRHYNDEQRQGLH